MDNEMPEHDKLRHEDYPAIERFAMFLSENNYYLTVVKAHGDEMPVDVEIEPISAVYHYFDVNERLLNKEIWEQLKRQRETNNKV